MDVVLSLAKELKGRSAENIEQQEIQFIRQQGFFNALCSVFIHISVTVTHAMCDTVVMRNTFYLFRLIGNRF